MSNIEITPQIFAFCNTIAAGEPAYKSYNQHLATKQISGQSSRSSASKLLKYPEIQQLIEKLKKERQQAINKVNKEITEEVIKSNMEVLPPEFFGMALTVENLDQLHYSIIKGLVEVEEVIPVKKTTKNPKGKVIEETVSFMRVKRKPNIRERQASIDALYKRGGHYAPTKGLFGFGKVGPNDEEPGENVQRFVMLSNGEKIPF